MKYGWCHLKDIQYVGTGVTEVFPQFLTTDKKYPEIKLNHGIHPPPRIEKFSTP